jgi:hypothetical protein
MSTSIAHWRAFCLLLTLAGTVWGLVQLPVILGSRNQDCPPCGTLSLLVLVVSSNLFTHLLRKEIRAYKRRKEQGPRNSA